MAVGGALAVFAFLFVGATSEKLLTSLAPPLSRFNVPTRPVLCASGIELVTLKGRRKTGTTWTEGLMSDIIFTYCALNPKRCKASGSQREYPGLRVDWFRENCHWRFNIVEEDNTLSKHQKVAWLDGRLPSNESVVCVVRDPRDTLVSLCYYQKGEACQPSAFLRQKFLATIEYMAENTEEAQQLGQLVMTYEASQQYPLLTMHRLSRFLGMPLPSPELMRIYGQNAFDVFRERELNGTLIGRNAVAKAIEGAGPIEHSKAKTRKGEVGGFEDDLSSDDIAWANDMMRKHMPDSWERCYVSKTLAQPCFPNVLETPRVPSSSFVDA